MQKRGKFHIISGVTLLLAVFMLTACGAGKGAASVDAVKETEAVLTPAAAPTADAEGTAPVSAPAADKETPPPAATDAAQPQESSVPSPAAAAPVDELDSIRALIAEGSYYEAFQAMQAFEAANDDPDRHAACEALFSELDSLLGDMEPVSGTELARSFSIQGSGILEISAWSGPVLVTAIDAAADPQENPAPDFVRFYVRKGELGSIFLPPGTYRILYQVGYRWFGDEIGFGEYCTEGELEEPLIFEFRMEGGWSSNSKYTITL